MVNPFLGTVLPIFSCIKYWSERYWCPAGVVAEQAALKQQLEVYVAEPLLAAALPSTVSTPTPLWHG